MLRRALWRSVRAFSRAFSTPIDFSSDLKIEWK
jgi:hypothetical protein